MIQHNFNTDRRNAVDFSMSQSVNERIVMMLQYTNIYIVAIYAVAILHRVTCRVARGKNDTRINIE